jgi:hypothetical protein
MKKEPTSRTPDFEENSGEEAIVSPAILHYQSTKEWVGNQFSPRIFLELIIDALQG